MVFQKLVFSFAFILAAIQIFASDLNIEGIEWNRGADPAQYKIKFTLSWNNQGGQKGIISVEFPKGFQGFYMMKYETTQGQYVAFLNCISNAATVARANFGSRDYYSNRGSIRFDKEKYIAASPGRPCNCISKYDPLVFLYM